MRRAHFSDLAEHGEIGDWAFADEYRKIIFIYPWEGGTDSEGHGEMVVLPIRSSTYPNDDKRAWDWNGNTDAPTLRPSVLVWDDFNAKKQRWHGWLTDGKLVTA